MSIFAKVILDSVSPDGIRLTTLHLHFPRFLLPEFNTHRAFSRNARSTRAVPTSKLINEVMNNPYVPIRWGKNKPGMQSTEEVSKEEAAIMEESWRSGAREAAFRAQHLFDLGLHKQWAGRVLEPYMWVDVLVTSTDWSNFFALRNEEGAQPEIRELACQMIVALKTSIPDKLSPGQWHLPYIESDDYYDITGYIQFLTGEQADPIEIMEIAKKISVARCARLSYAPFDGNGSIEKELDRYEKLMVSQPVHASPAEHQATPDHCIEVWDWFKKKKKYTNPQLHGNFYGWRQFRKTIPNEAVFDR